MKKQRSVTTLLGLFMAIAMSSLSVAGGASAAAPGPAPIVVKSQDCCDSGQVVVDSAVAAQDGWLGILKDSNGSISSLVGYVPVVKGKNGPLMVDVNSERASSAPTLWAVFLVDMSGTGIFDASTVALAPNSPMVAFATQAAALTAPTTAPAAAAPAASQPAAAPVAKGPVTNQIVVKSQDCCDSGQVVVDSAVAAQDGWLGILKDSNGSISSLVGYVPVVKGKNGPLMVDVNSERASSAPTLWAVFLVDMSGTGIFDASTVALAPNSPMVAFATTAAGK